MKCKYCKGTGWHFSSFHENCKSCKGTGKISFIEWIKSFNKKLDKNEGKEIILKE